MDGEHLFTFTICNPGWSPLVVDIMLSRLSNANQQFPNGFTCLAAAAAAAGKQLLMAKRLLHLGADINMPSVDRSLTPLNLAAENACVEMIGLFLYKGASINSRSRSKTTPFYRAARGGSIEILRLLH
jgi:ankyrin repeat protein